MKEIILRELNISEFTEIIREVISEEITSHIRDLSTPKEEELLSRELTAKFLGVSYVTLNKWTKEKRILGYSLGKRVYYKKSELLDSIKPMGINNYR